jgi:FkbM family methyltransferase
MPGFSMTFFPSSLSAAYWINPNARNHDAKLIGTLLNEGDTFIDIGANIGVLSCMAATCVGPGGKVLSFEPHPRIFSYLERNINRNNFAQIHAFGIGLGASESILYFRDGQADDMNSIADSGIPVRVRRLDDVIAEQKVERIRLMKVDVEGFELEVFKGANDTLKFTEMVYFEAYEEQYGRFGYGYSQIHEFLSDRGFDVYESVTGGKLSKEFVPATCCDLLAVRRDAPVALDRVFG